MKHLNIYLLILFISLWSRNALTSMKPNAAEDSVFLQERTLGKGVKVIRDEVVNGEYGLVINGHSLVRHKKFSRYFSCCHCLSWLACYIKLWWKSGILTLHNIKTLKHHMDLILVWKLDFNGSPSDFFFFKHVISWLFFMTPDSFKSPTFIKLWGNNCYHP